MKPGLLFAVLAVLLTTALTPAASGTEDSCLLCAGSPPVPVVRLTSTVLDSLAEAHARFNAAQLGRLDSLLRSEHYGPARSKDAREKAHLLARITMINAYRDLIRLATSSTRIYEASGADFEELQHEYSDVTLFSTVRLARVRLGLGRVCMHYDLDEKGKGKAIQGGRELNWRVKDEEIDGQKRRLLNLDLPTGTDDVVEVFLAPHHSFAVEYTRIEGPPAPYEWYLAYDLQGGWLRKWGTHKPAAYMFWVTPAELMIGPGEETLARSEMASTDGAFEVPRNPLVGVRVYIPGLRLRLPLFLPDFNFDDLREAELPVPILHIEHLQKNDYPEWLGKGKGLGFKEWKGWGPVPPDIRRRFPDL